MFTTYDPTYNYTTKALKLSQRQTDSLRTELYKATFNKPVSVQNYNSYLWLRKLNYSNKITSLTFTAQYQ